MINELQIAAARKNLAVWQEEITTATSLGALQIKGAVRDFLDAQQAPPDTAALRRLAEVLAGTEGQTAAQCSPEAAIAFIEAVFAFDGGFSPDEPPSAGQSLQQGPVTVAYFDSAAFAEATARFSLLAGEVTPLPCQSFTAAAEEVANGKATFALLPIEDATQGRLTRFYEQIDRFELHAAAALDVFDAEGTQVRVALVGKSVLTLHQKASVRAVECLLFEESAQSLPLLLQVAAALGLSLRRIDSLPSSYRDGGFFKHLVLEGGEGACRRLRTYLALFMPRTSVTADYIIIT